MLPKCLPPRLGSIRLTIREQTWFEDFQDGQHRGHLGYQNGTILAILILYVAPMPPIKFQLHQTYSLGGDVVWRFSRWLIWRPSWILEQKDFNNSKSPCGPNASHQVWAQSDLGFGSRCGFKIFKMATQAAILDSQTEWFKQFWISMSLHCFPSSCGSIQLTVWKELSFEEFQDAPSHPPGGHLGYRNETFLAILNL